MTGFPMSKSYLLQCLPLNLRPGDIPNAAARQSGTSQRYDVTSFGTYSVRAPSSSTSVALPFIRISGYEQFYRETEHCRSASSA